jgi:hypothetical protein
LLLQVTDFTEANDIMAMYALDLARGNTLLCKTIKSDTISKYLLAAARKIQGYRARKHIKSLNRGVWTDPRIDMATGKHSTRITAITKEVSRWENEPNRREPLTVDMIRHTGTKCDPSTPHSIENAMYDWFVLNIYIGCRLSEWAQSECGMTLSKTDEPRAFMWKDIELRGENDRRMDISDGLARPYLVHTAVIRWREQKNGTVNQKKTIVKQFGNASLCPVTALIRILKRFRDLKQDKDAVPLSVFTTNGLDDGMVELIRASHIEHALQSAATAVYNITNPKELARFTSHSLRVGACVALHAAGVIPSNIKDALRWKSDSFERYLRNLPCQAQRNSRAVVNFSPTRLDIPVTAASFY